jgi:hypothetical protein
VWLVWNDVTTFCESEDSRTRSRELCASTISSAIGYRRHRCFTQKERMKILWVSTHANTVVSVVGLAQLLSCIPFLNPQAMSTTWKRTKYEIESWISLRSAVHLPVTDWHSSASPLSTPQRADRLHSHCTPTWKTLIMGWIKQDSFSSPELGMESPPTLLMCLTRRIIMASLHTQT